MRWILGLALCLSSSGCTTARFLTQAAAGQWRLNRNAVSIEELEQDPKTSEQTRDRLKQLARVRAYGERHGLLMHENYRSYIDLQRPYVVWFVNASHPMAFLPLTFGFPIVGSFPGLSWFDESRAVEFKEWLETYGWDVNVRGVTAFSTGGWFEDPVLSSMFYDHPAAVGLFANTILHESLHATVLVADQQYFNESLASFVADTMTPKFLREAYPAQPKLLEVYEKTRQMNREFVRKLVWTFQQLNQLYQSPIEDWAKLMIKQNVIDQLMAEIPFPERPNNATLIGFQLYQEGTAEFEDLYDACEHSWPKFIRAVDSLRAEHFAEPQTLSIGNTVRLLTAAECEPLPPSTQQAPVSKQLELHRRSEFQSSSQEGAKNSK
jgi:predicted aminopeptidase